MAQKRRDGNITQKNDASGINNKRGMAKRAKRHSSKRDRKQVQLQSEKEIQALFAKGKEYYDSHPPTFIFPE